MKLAKKIEEKMAGKDMSNVGWRQKPPKMNEFQLMIESAPQYYWQLLFQCLHDLTMLIIF
jgi:hypothetical protein